MGSMTRRFAAITVFLAMAVGAMIGLVLAGNLTPTPAHSAPKARVAAPATMRSATPAGAADRIVAQPVGGHD